jgi:AcrR family transcriptional regulator
LATRIPATQGRMRKEPRQQRARETVEAILQATAHILARRGWGALTTNKVAEAAGVSIGSLYQYFPSKLALIEAVRRRHFHDVLSALETAADRTRSQAERIEGVVRGMIREHGRDPGVHEVLMEEAPRGRDSRAAHDEFEAEYLRRYEALIGASGPALNPARCKIAAQVLSAAIAGVVHDAARRGTLTTPGLEHELIRLVSAYLGSPAINPKRTRKKPPVRQDQL